MGRGLDRQKLGPRASEIKNPIGRREKNWTTTQYIQGNVFGGRMRVVVSRPSGVFYSVSAIYICFFINCRLKTIQTPPVSHTGRDRRLLNAVADRRVSVVGCCSLVIRSGFSKGFCGAILTKSAARISCGFWVSGSPAQPSKQDWRFSTESDGNTQGGT